jgi:hypothetical protein
MIVPDKALLPSITNSISQIQNDSRRTLPAWATRCPRTTTISIAAHLLSAVQFETVLTRENVPR